MKKIVGIAVVAMMAASLFAGGKKEKKAAEPYVITEGDGVVAYYSFDEDEIEDDLIVDHSGMGNDTDSNTLDDPTLEDGIRGNALFFNGDDQYLMLSDDLLTGEGMTIAMWVKPEGWKDWQRVFDIGDGKTCDAWCGMDFATKMLRLDVFSGKGAVTIMAPLPPAGKWSHIAVTIGKGMVTLYVNGKPFAKDLCPTATSDLLATVNGIFVGRSNWPDPLFFGLMDEVVAANRVFSSKEIKALATAGVTAPDAE